MPILHWSRTGEQAAPATAPTQSDQTGREVPAPRPGTTATGPASPVSPDRQRPAPAPRTRTSAAWAGLWAAAVLLIAFIVFLLSNTGSVQISFAGFHGDLPLAVALLIAMVTGVVVTLIVGTARITQIRRLARKSRR